jgi:tRNA pseudouridine55 synthase
MEKSGVINLYKPADITSHQATKKVQKITGAGKAGHSGTLDPFAEGILLVCINEATRITEYLSELEKEYIATIRLGIETDTHDITGSVIVDEECGSECIDPKIRVPVSRERLLEVLERFRGEIMQVPPMYSAIKVKGVPLYRFARKGIEIERGRRRVNISRLELTDYSYPDLVVMIRCSKGTYIRSLAHDIGRALGTGAVVVSLKRTAVGHFKEKDAVTFEELKEGKYTIIEMDRALKHLQELHLTDEQFRLARHGTGFRVTRGALKRTPNARAGEVFRLKGPDGEFFGTGIIDEGLQLKVRKVFSGCIKV